MYCGSMKGVFSPTFQVLLQSFLYYIFIIFLTKNNKLYTNNLMSKLIIIFVHDYNLVQCSNFCILAYICKQVCKGGRHLVLFARAGSVADFPFRYLASVKPYRFGDTESRNYVLVYPQSNRPTNWK